MTRIIWSSFDPDPTLEVGRDGLWRYRGNLIRHPESLRLFKSNLRRESSGQWRTWWGKSSLKVTVDGPPWIVKVVELDGDRLTARLDTGRLVETTSASLRVVEDRLALLVDEGLAALSSEAASSLMDMLDGDDNAWTLQGKPIPQAKGWQEAC